MNEEKQGVEMTRIGDMVLKVEMSDELKNAFKEITDGVEAIMKETAKLESRVKELELRELCKSGR